jgi:hypothetical protein
VIAVPTSITAPVACDLSVLSDVQGDRLTALTGELFPSADVLAELPDGRIPRWVCLSTCRSAH